MDRAVFFAELRKRGSGIFGTSLSQRQVEGTEALLDAGQGLPLEHLAHALGEVYHETGGGMYPVKETVYASSENRNPSDAQVIARLDRAFAKGQLTWVRTPYWRGGWFGRGQVQLTHEANYRKMSPIVGVDLVADPGKALVPAISAKIAVEGMRRGIFTGKRLAEYDRSNGYDHYSARAIVNGDVSGNGPKVAKYARAFAAALHAAGYDATASEPPREAPKAPAAQEVPQAGGWLSALVSALLSVFRK